MKVRRNTVLLLGVLMIVGAIVLVGCKKEEPAATPQPTPKSATDQNEAMGTDMSGMAHQATAKAGQMANDMASTMKTAAKETADQAQAGILQKTCPVMEGNPIDPNVFVEYNGKKVYFCCAECKDKFLADPEKYIAKLPQFNEK
jgi:YHS domain-containing protein